MLALCWACLKHWLTRSRLQFELYSSRVHSFELRGRQTHPRHDGIEYGKGLNLTHWWLLGKYNASNTKGTQVTLARV